MGNGSSKAVANLAAGLAELSAFIATCHKSYIGYSYDILVDDGGKLAAYERVNLPCYGELRPYAKGSAGNGPFEPDLMPEVQRKVSKPTDLYYPFPKGHPVAVAVPFSIQSTLGAEWNQILEEVVLNPEVSPWRDALKEFTLTKKGEHISGIIITDTKINPTIMVNMFRNISRHLGKNHVDWYNKLKKHGLSNLEAFILSQMTVNNSGTISFITTNDYQTFGPNPNFARLMAGKPVDRTGGTFYDRYAYDRPKQDYQWNDDKTATDEDDEVKGVALYKKVAEVTGIKGSYATYNEKHIPIIVDEFKKLVAKASKNKFAKAA